MSVTEDRSRGSHPAVRRSVIALAAMFIATGCGSDTAPKVNTTPSAVTVVSGDGQVGLVGSALSTPLTVKVVSSGVALSGVNVTFAVTSGAGSVSPSTTATDASGQAKTTLTLGATAGNVTVSATVAGTGITTISASFIETAATTNIALACASGSPTTPGVGTALPGVSGSGICLAGGSAGADYALVGFYGTSDNAASTSFSVQSHGGATAVTAASLAPIGDQAFGGRTAAPTYTDNALQSQFDAQLRAAARRDLTPLIPAARLARHLKPALASIPSSPAVGTLFTLNANGVPGQSCSNPINVIARVAAVSNLAIVVADTANPAGGFSDAEYASFAATFDTLVSPIDIAAFGQPTDIDGNGKIIIFFTKEVNKLTPRGSGGVIGGFFHERDLFPTTSTNLLQGCATSNVAEMYYSLVPDPTGKFSDVRSKSYVQTNTPGTLVHEFQHLINAGRRIYVNNASDLEEVWLNEGLSHVAEELLYYHVAHLTPRQNISFATLTVDTVSANAFNNYQGANFGRFQTFLQKQTGQTGVYAENDSLETRGATWNLLRYLADHRGASDADTWMQLDNSTTAGLQNLANVFASDKKITTVIGQIRDWATSVFADDDGVLDDRFNESSWNMRNIFPHLVNGSGTALNRFPLNIIPLSDAVPANVSIRAGGVAYLRFSVPPNASASIDWSSAGLPVSPLLQFTVVRTR